MVLDFSAAWCAPCKRMEEETFPNPTVKALLALTIFVTIDTDEHAEAAYFFDVAAIPEIHFFSPDGQRVKRILGFQDAETLSKALKDLLEKSRNVDEPKSTPN